MITDVIAQKRAAISTEEQASHPLIDVHAASWNAERERETRRRSRRAQRPPPSGSALRFVDRAALIVPAGITILSQEGQNTWPGLLPPNFVNDDNRHNLSTDQNSHRVCNGQCIPTSQTIESEHHQSRRRFRLTTYHNLSATYIRTHAGQSERYFLRRPSRTDATRGEHLPVPIPAQISRRNNKEQERDVRLRVRLPWFKQAGRDQYAL